MHIPAGSVLSAQRLLPGAAFAFWEALMRTRVYVDGLNLYHRAVKGTPFKWLDLVKLSALVLPSTCVVDKLLYFTAHVSGTFDPGAPRRQQMYLNALRTLPEVEIHFGQFLAKIAWRPIINLPVAGRPIRTPQLVTLPAGDHPVASAAPPPQTLSVGSYGDRHQKRTPLPDAVIAAFHQMEEKGSDVNLAAHLLNDAWKGQFDAAAVISNDTDLVTPIRMVAAEQGKPVFVVCPRSRRMAPALRQVATYKRYIRRPMLRAAQFPDPIPGTAISKPASW